MLSAGNGLPACRCYSGSEYVVAGRLDAEPSRVFGFDEIHEAHRVMEANEAGEKRVVVF
jgi:hypothetical protein